MKNKEQIKQILERNIGITETKERVNLKAIAELNDINYKHAIDGTNGEEQWLDMKQNMLAAVYDGLYRMNVTFDLDLKICYGIKIVRWVYG